MGLGSTLTALFCLYYGAGAFPNQNVQLATCAVQSEQNQRWVSVTPGTLPALVAQKSRLVPASQPAIALSLSPTRCMTIMVPSGNAELADCNVSFPQSTQLFHVVPNGSIFNAANHSLCLGWDKGSGSNTAAAGNIAASPAYCATSWTLDPQNMTQRISVRDERLLGLQCLDVGSGGEASTNTSVALLPAAPAAVTGPQQAYYNESAPAWGAAVMKINGVYHMWVTTQAKGSGNDPNAKNSFVKSARIDHAIADSPLGPYRCIQENVLREHMTRFAGNPQIFRAAGGELLLAVIGVKCAVYISRSNGPDGPWDCASMGAAFNNPTLVPMPNGSIILFFHNVGGWGTAVSAAVSPGPRGPYTLHKASASWKATMPPRPSYANQIFVHPCEDPFAWFDAKAGRFRMLLHTFRMGMICGAGTATACGDGVDLLGGEPYGAFASSSGPDPFSGWQYIENELAYNWSIPAANGTSYTLRRRERPFLFFDDDGKVYLFTSASPANTSQQMYAHVQEVVLPEGFGPPPRYHFEDVGMSSLRALTVEKGEGSVEPVRSGLKQLTVKSENALYF